MRMRSLVVADTRHALCRLGRVRRRGGHRLRVPTPTDHDMRNPLAPARPNPEIDTRTCRLVGIGLAWTRESASTD